MKKIINQKRYDTETAQEKGFWHNSYGYRDFNYCEETLYQKKTGEFFLHGSGGPMTNYAKRVDGNSWSVGDELIPLTYEEAREWAEEKLDAEDYEAIFGEVTEDGSRVTIGISLPTGAAEQLKRMAAQTGKTQSDIIAELITGAVTRCDTK